jgi:sugar (pentulose or hexulose) kinase
LGGGARSTLWRQIQADAFGHEVEIVGTEEGAAYSAAILAGVGARTWPSVDEACDSIIRIAKRVPLDTRVSAAMQRNYEVYRRIYPALRSLGEVSATARGWHDEYSLGSGDPLPGLRLHLCSASSFSRADIG